MRRTFTRFVLALAVLVCGVPSVVAQLAVIAERVVAETACSGNQGSCPITQVLTRYSTVVAGDDATLPTPEAGGIVYIVNDGANNLDVWPATGDSITGLGANVATPLPSRCVMMCLASDADTWSCAIFARLTVYGTNSTNHGVALWGTTNTSFDTGDEVCAFAGLTCKTTAVGATESSCATVNTVNYLAFCY